MDNDRLQKQIDFLLEADKEKEIFRQTSLASHGRKENDAEHAWHMALAAFLLQEYANEKVDIARVMAMCLIHDIVEIDAGDTYAYDEANLKTQREREQKAADRLFSLLPDDQCLLLRGLFEEFEACETPDARFAKAMDNFQPFILNDSNEGSDWIDHQVTRSQVMGRQKKTRLGSRELYGFIVEKINSHVMKGHLKDE